MEGLFFTVGEAPAARDVGKTLAHLAPADMRTLGCGIGDVVAVEGRRLTVARLAPMPEAEWGRQAILIDGMTRGNAAAGIGEKVRVWKVAWAPAQVVVVRPLGEGPLKPKMNDNYLGMFLDGLVVVRGDRVRAQMVGNHWQEYIVEDVGMEGPVLCTASTLVQFASSPEGPVVSARVSYEDVGGLGSELQRIREMIELPLSHPELFGRLGIDPPRGVLMFGPPGCGKTLIARAVAAESRAHFVHVNGPEIMHKFYGQSEANLRSKFDEAKAMAPSIIFLDELDAIAPRREEVRGEVEKRVVAQLLTLMDGLDGRGQVVVIGASNLPEAVDPALRRPGRFDREIAIGAPDKSGRLQVLQIHARGMPLAPDVDLGRVAEATPGFVGADLAAICREAAMLALRRVMPSIDDEGEAIPAETLGALTVCMADFEASLAEAEPSALREVTTEVSDVPWSAVGGLEEAKQQLEEAVVWPLQHRGWYARMGGGNARGVLIVGAPGTGKSLLAQALANRCGVHFITVSAPSLLSKWVGETEKAIHSIFQRARQVSPCLVFFDELDSLFPPRDAAATQAAMRAVSQFLTELDALVSRSSVVVVAATSRPDLLDPAVLRAGRFDLVVPLPLPDLSARRSILSIHTAALTLAPAVDLDDLARRTEGFSGADLASLCRRAAQTALADLLRAAAGGEPEAAAVLGRSHWERALAALLTHRVATGHPLPAMPRATTP